MVRELILLSAVSLFVVGCGDSNTPPPTTNIRTTADEVTLPEQDEPVVTAMTEQPTVVLKTTPEPLPPETAFDRLCTAYTSGDADGWAAAEKEILESGAGATPSLVVALTDGAEHQRELAASLLAQTGAISPPAKLALRKALSDDSAFVRANAAAALCAIGDVSPELLGTIEELLGREEQESRLMAVMSLGNLGPEAAGLVSKVVPMLDDTDTELRHAATTTLGRLGSKGAVAIEKLQALESDDPEAEIRQSATAALALIRGDEPKTGSDESADSGTNVIPASSSKEVEK
jgi:hypothetical protein